MELVELSGEQWAQIASTTMKYAFDYEYPKEKSRVSKALIVQDPQTLEPIAFMTLVTMDSETVYLQHGGNFPAGKGTRTFKAYLMMLERVKAEFQILHTRIFNRNLPMIKLALAAGFVIVGTQLDKHGDLYLVLEILVGERSGGIGTE